MSAVVITGGRAHTICAADLWEPCPLHHVVHWQDVVTVGTPDEWFPPLPTPPSLTAAITAAFRKVFA